MKKYFLKIAGLTTIAIPLVVIVACSKENSKALEKKSLKKPLTLKEIKAKFVNTNSFKEKIDITLPAIDATITPFDLYDITGYKVPNIPETFTITYKIKSRWKAGADSEKFNIEVFITKGGVTERKIFTIIAKDYYFTQAKAKIMKKFTTKKMMIEIGPLAISDTPRDDYEKIGYKTPTNLPPGVNVKSYTIASGWKKYNGVDNFDIKLILKKGTQESKPILVTIMTKPFSMTATKALIQDEITKELNTSTAKFLIKHVKSLIQDAVSSKTRAEIDYAYDTKGANGVTLEDLGYNTLSSIDWVTITLQFLSEWEGTSYNQFRIQITITKKGTTAKESKIIRITAKPTPE